MIYVNCVSAQFSSEQNKGSIQQEYINQNESNYNSSKKINPTKSIPLFTINKSSAPTVFFKNLPKGTAFHSYDEVLTQSKKFKQDQYILENTEFLFQEFLDKNHVDATISEAKIIANDQIEITSVKPSDKNVKDKDGNRIQLNDTLNCVIDSVFRIFFILKTNDGTYSAYSSYDINKNLVNSNCEPFLKNTFHFSDGYWYETFSYSPSANLSSSQLYEKHNYFNDYLLFSENDFSKQYLISSIGWNDRSDKTLSYYEPGIDTLIKKAANQNSTEKIVSIKRLSDRINSDHSFSNTNAIGEGSRAYYCLLTEDAITHNLKVYRLVFRVWVIPSVVALDSRVVKQISTIETEDDNKSTDETVQNYTPQNSNDLYKEFELNQSFSKKIFNLELVDDNLKPLQNIEVSVGDNSNLLKYGTANSDSKGISVFQDVPTTIDLIVSVKINQVIYQYNLNNTGLVTLYIKKSKK